MLRHANSDMHKKFNVCGQATAKADKVAEMAQRVLEYRSALLLDGGPQRCGMVWKQVHHKCLRS